MNTPDPPADVAILMPVYDDWASAASLVRQLDRTADRSTRIHVVLVDDASPVPPPADFGAEALQTVRSITRVRLSRNLGHQRAIAIGLAHVHAAVPCRYVVVMDADGEDRAEDAWTLLRHAEADPGGAIVFAARARRSEGPLFRAGYIMYRCLHRLLTGIAVRVGNFSVVPAARLPAVMSIAELWNHYAAGIFKARLPLLTVPIDRGQRLAGRSRMNLSALLLHGLSAVSVFSELVGIRILIFLLGVSASCGGLYLAALLRGGGTPADGLGALGAVAGWGFAAAFSASWITLYFLLGILHLRSGVGFLPGRDYVAFIDRAESLYERHA